MAKRAEKVVKPQIPAGKATPTPPVGPALGQAGINVMGFTKEFNARTADQAGMIIPVVILVYEDGSFDFVIKTPPAAAFLKKAAGVERGSGTPNTTEVAAVTRAQIQEIAETKMPDLNIANTEFAVRMIGSTARSMGFTVVSQSIATQSVVNWGDRTVPLRLIHVRPARLHRSLMSDVGGFKSNQYDHITRKILDG